MEKRSFKIVVEGQYQALHDLTGTPTIKFYTAEFILPSQEAALSVICKHLLSPYLRKKHSDYIRYRTHKLVSITSTGRKPNPEVLQMTIQEMSVEQLSDFCILKGIMIDPYKHSDLPLTRERVAAHWNNLLLMRKDKEKSGQADAQKEIDALLAANELPIEKETVLVNVNERKATIAASKDKPQAAVGRPPGFDVPDGMVEEDAPLPPVEQDAGLE